MIYISDEEFRALKSEMARRMLRVADKCGSTVINNSRVKGISNKSAALEEISAEILTEELDIWPAYTSPESEIISLRRLDITRLTIRRPLLSLGMLIIAAAAWFADVDHDGYITKADIAIMIDDLAYMTDLPEMYRNILTVKGEHIRLHLIKKPGTDVHYAVDRSIRG